MFAPMIGPALGCDEALLGVSPSGQAHGGEVRATNNLTRTLPVGYTYPWIATVIQGQ